MAKPIPSKSSDSPEEEAAESTVRLSEEFQSKVTPIIQSATKPELDYMRSLISEKEQEMQKTEFKMDSQDE